MKTLLEQLSGDFRQGRDRASTSTFCLEVIRLNGKLYIILTGNRKDCRVYSQGNEFGKIDKQTIRPDKPGMHHSY